jgi:hypothetical protein
MGNQEAVAPLAQAVEVNVYLNMMRFVARLRLLPLLLLPSLAYASGGEIIALFGLELFALIVILIVIIRGELHGLGKVASLLAFAISTGIAGYMARDLPYRDNANLIHAVIVGLPIGIFIVAYIGISKYLEKRADGSSPSP